MSEEPKAPYWVTAALILAAMAFGVAFWVGVFSMIAGMIGAGA